MMKTVFKNLTSRKFLAAAAGVVTGLALVFGLDENVITAVAGAVTALCSVVSYIVTEGKIDAQSAQTAAEAVNGAKEAYERAK